jgi:hypothetical protein
MVAAGSSGETITLRVDGTGEQATVSIAPPRSLAGLDGDAMLALEATDEAEGAPLLGTGFALRVARNLATELGGALDLGPGPLTLRLPAVLDRCMEQATTI